MSLRLARVDDRLIHGQVLHGWVPRLNVDLLVVADAEMAGSKQEQDVAQLAVPPSVEVAFVDPAQVPEMLQAANGQNVLVLFRTPVQALEAFTAGLIVDQLNLGNLHFEPGKIQLRKTFCCSNKELRALRAIAEQGVEIAYQPAPDLKRVELDAAAF